MSFRGNELRLQREEMGLSREDVFRKVRIPLHIIERIETGDSEPLPATIYTIGFIKTYCDLLGRNPEPYISELVTESQEPKGIINQAIHGDSNDSPIWLREAIMWGTIVALIVIGWVTYSVVFQPNTPEDAAPVQADEIDFRVPHFPIR